MVRNRTSLRAWSLGLGVLMCAVVPLPAQESEKEQPKEKTAFFASPVKKGMTKEEVTQAIGKPYYISGAKDPGGFLKKQQELRKYGTIMELWMYRVPYNFIVYFTNGKVSSVEYVGSTARPVPEAGEGAGKVGQ